jgi:AcrR family transcriptional regulator
MSPATPAASAATADAAADRRAASPARRRVLETASALFYAEGVHAVGIDRIIAEAKVAKATFYHHFPAKDALVDAYVAEQFRFQREIAEAFLAEPGDGDPRAALVRIFTYMTEAGADPAFRGCPFVNVAAEYPDPEHPVRRTIAEHRAWFLDLMRRLLAAADDPAPDRTAGILLLLRDGLTVRCYLDDASNLRPVVEDTLERVLGAAPES